MIALPWYLLSLGILLFNTGSLGASFSKAGSQVDEIDPDMKDDDIVENLKSQGRLSFSGIIVLLGLLCILISVVWRLFR